MSGRLYCTTLKGADGNTYGGPNIRANSFRQAERRAERVGAIVSGELGGAFNADTLHPCEPSSGNFDMNKRAREDAEQASRIRMRFASIIRRWASRLCSLADAVEPCQSRRRIFSARP